MQPNQQTVPPGYAAPAAAASTTHIWDYWAVIAKRLVMVVAFLVVCLGAAYVITQRQQKLYRSTATIQVLPPSVMAASGSFAPMVVSDESYLLTQLELLRMPETVQRAVKEANLANQPDFKGKNENEIALMAFDKVQSSRRRGLYLVDVSVIGPEPKVLDDLTNALVDTFRTMQRSEARQRREDSKARLDEKAAQADSQIKLLTIDKQNALQGQNFTETTFESEFDKISESRKNFDKQADDLAYQLLQDQDTYNAFLQARQDPARGTAALAQHPYILLEPQFRALNVRLSELADQAAVTLREKGRIHPEYLGIEAEIEKVTRQKARTVDDIVNTFVLSYQGKMSVREYVLKQVDAKTQEMLKAAEVKRKVDGYQQEIARYRENKDAAVREREILVQGTTDEKDAVRIEARAAEPSYPYAPNPTTNMTLGGVIGLVGGIALAFLLDYLDDTIRTKDELAKIAPDVPLLGVVPNIEARKTELAKKDLYAANQPKSTISEAYRGVRTALTLSARGPAQKALLLTSAGPREGKTTTCMNLATVLAFSGARTLIVDADLRKPRIHASFNLPNKKGLTNLIVGEEDPAEYCQRTHLDKVDLLTSGPIPPNPSELLGRPRMREILRRLRERYDHIVIDTPPIGAVTDAAILATMVDGVILVVHAGKTRRQIVSRGLEQLRYISAPVIGVILNNLRLGRSRYYPGYYHYYYYYYASHYGAEDRKSKKGAKETKAPAAADAPPAGDPPKA